MLGTTTIEELPERVVAVGMADADIAVALGVEPLTAIEDPYRPGNPYPWLEGLIDTDRTEMIPQVDTGLVSMEQILALRPDLVLATTATAPPEAYDLLTQAGVPVVVPVKGYLEDSWQDLTRLIGRALGRSERAEEVVAETEAAVRAVADRNPGLAGKTVVVALDRGADGFNILTDPENYSVKLFADLGMRLPERLADAEGGDTAGGLVVSAERVDLLEADALFMTVAMGNQKRLGSDPLFNGLATVQRGTFLAWEPKVAGGVRIAGPLSIAYVLEQIEPTLAKVAGLPPLDVPGN